MKSFYCEAKYLKKNRHKNIVGFIDAEVVNAENNINIKYFYIYLNYIGGYNLNEFYSKVGFFTKQLLKKFIEHIIFFMDYMKKKAYFIIILILTIFFSTLMEILNLLISAKLINNMI